MTSKGGKNQNFKAALACEIGQLMEASKPFYAEEKTKQKKEKNKKKNLFLFQVTFHPYIQHPFFYSLKFPVLNNSLKFFAMGSKDA